jgi:uncharacterized membrane protein
LTSSSGLSIFNIGKLTFTPVTASVEVPNGTGVNIVANSFNIPPTRTVQGTAFDTLEWDLTLTSTTRITWQSTVSDLGAEESRPLTLGTTVDFVSHGTPGTISGPAATVTGASIIQLMPQSETARPDETVTYDVRLSNLTNATVTYYLSVQQDNYFAGTDLPYYVQVAPQATVDLPLSLTPYSFQALGDYTFAVTAQDYTGRVHGSAASKLTVAGENVEPIFADSDAHGVVLALTPSLASVGQGQSAHYVLRLINTGSIDESYTLQAAGLPDGVNADFGRSYVDVPPGLSNFREVPMTLTPARGTAAGSYEFIVSASSSRSSATGVANGTLMVLANGVHVSLNPPSDLPGKTFQMTITNTGQATDTFELSLGGPGALVASLAQNEVTLAPGESQVVSVRTKAVDFAVPGTLSFSAIAKSQSIPDVTDQAAAELAIASVNGLNAHVDPSVRVLPVPGTTSFLLLVNNTGNVEDAFTATITGTLGPITAHLMGLDGQPAASIPIFRLPGLSTAAILLQTDMPAPGTGMVNVQVRSLSDTNEVADTNVLVTAHGTAQSPIAEPASSPEPPSNSAPSQVTKPVDLAFALLGLESASLLVKTANVLLEQSPAVLSFATTFLTGPQRPLLDGAEMETLIQGRVFVEDGPTASETSQTGLSGVKVLLRSTQGTGGPSDVRTTVTDKDGGYEFRDLPFGKYEIQVEFAPSLRQTTPPGNKRTVDLGPGNEVVIDVNFNAQKPKQQPPAPRPENQKVGPTNEGARNVDTPKSTPDKGVIDLDSMISHDGAGLSQDDAQRITAGAEFAEIHGTEPAAERETGSVGARRWLLAGVAAVSCLYPWRRSDRKCRAAHRSVLRPAQSREFSCRGAAARRARR